MTLRPIVNRFFSCEKRTGIIIPFLFLSTNSYEQTHTHELLLVSYHNTFLLISEHNPDAVPADPDDNRENVNPRDYRVPVVWSIAPQVSDTVDGTRRVQYPHIAEKRGPYTYGPAFIPSVDRYQSRYNESLYRHEHREVSAIKHCE